jgi:Holliday junction resolvase RusA-like endonuclease
MIKLNKLKLVSPVPCSVNHYIKPRAFIKNGKAQVTLYETKEAKKYKKDFTGYVIDQIKEQGFNFKLNNKQHFYVDCIFFFDQIDMDANNYFKLLLDSITDTKRIWLDDNVVCERVQGIYYDVNNPRIEIEIFPVDYIGVFSNQEQLESFESNCIHCNRYRERKCSILTKAIEGRIQDEVQNLICKKYKKRKGTE